MIAAKEMPVTIGVFVAPGDVSADGEQHHGAAQPLF